MNNPPRPKFRPYCGQRSVVKAKSGMSRCNDCRVVFVVSYSRQLRKPPRKKIP